MKPLIDACVFDAYGTLFDVHSAVRAHADRIGPKADEVSQLWRIKQLEYSWVRSLMGRHADFRQITAEALDYCFRRFSIKNKELFDDLLLSYQNLAAYADASDALKSLKVRGLTTAILSNGTPDWLEAAVAAAQIGPLVDATWSVETVGIFKPDRRVYEIAVDALALPAMSIGFVSSNPWDAAGAATFGMRAVWINRHGLPPEYGAVAAVPQLPDLTALARHYMIE